MQKHVSVIGGGFAGLAAACSLAVAGKRVTLFEKNASTGGRNRCFREQGFTFDMGPSWYWMPEVFESFFQRFGKNTSDYYNLVRLDPSYRVFFRSGPVDIPAGPDALKGLFEKLEPGSASKLDLFLAEAKVKYETAMSEFVWKPSFSYREYMSWNLLKKSFHLNLFSSVSAHIRKYFTHPEIIQLLEFPILFLGAKPANTPALYSMMNYADIELGTWYPMGGMHKITEAMTQLAKELGVDVHTNSPVERIVVNHGRAEFLEVNGTSFPTDAVIGAADYHHVETMLMEKQERNYSDKYWEGRSMSPSSLIFYVGVNKEVRGLQHHNLFFDSSFEKHAQQIYDEPGWPADPLFYICCPSKTDPSVAPQGMENLFFLVPLATGLTSTEADRMKYFEQLIQRVEKHTGEKIRAHVTYIRSYAHEEFINDYNAYRGNAYGLANTLRQTAFLKPSMRSNKISNLFYAGQLTVPGPGVPPAIISGQVAAAAISKYLTTLTTNPVAQ